MGRGLMGLHGWKRCSAALAVLAAVLFGQADGAQLAAADGAASTSTGDSSAPGDAPEWQIKAALTKYDDETFVALLALNPELVHFVYPNGSTLLEQAAYAGNLPAVEALLSQGADPNRGQSPPLSLALPVMDLRVPFDASITRTTFYEIIVALLKAGADYQFMDVENASFVESLIMSVCDPDYFSPDQLIPFHEADVQLQVERHLLRNMDKIRTLAKIELADSYCVSFFDSRIVSMNKA